MGMLSALSVRVGPESFGHAHDEVRPAGFRGGKHGVLDLATCVCSLEVGAGDV